MAARPGQARRACPIRRLDPGMPAAYHLSNGEYILEIHPIPMGVCTSYLIKAEGCLLVDSGQQGYVGAFQRTLAKINLAPSRITFIFLTHGHWDHIGGLGEIRQLTPAPVAINSRERDWVTNGLRPLPTPITRWGRVIDFVSRTFILPGQTFSGVPVDISLEDAPFSLAPYGIEGVLYHTPGHSSGSMSLLMNTGEAFVGDLAVGGPPQRLGPGLPVFADEPHRIKESWRALIELGAKWFYPAHGRPFPASALGAQLR
jgi:glyoxylase-like metal-dependent hydrolase (beta-lactamase superfamily II)